MICEGLLVRETADGLEVRLHVQPRAKRCEISGMHGGALKVKVMAPPIDDAANKAVLDFFSGLLGISKSSLRILAGLKSRDKILQVKGVSRNRFLERITAC